MTDKEQIIIDDCNVSECVHYEDLSCTAFRDSCGYPLDCKDFFFCNYKQLARKTQECENLKEEIEILKDNFDTATRDCNELIEELRQECEELNKLVEQAKEAPICFQCEQEPCIRQERDRYRKVLEEIEKYCNNVLSFTAVRTTESDILDIINKAKGEE